MSLTLLSQAGYRADKVRIACQYAGLSLNFPSFQIGKDNLTASYKLKNPWGKTPVLETPEGPLSESNAILRYIARSCQHSSLYGNSNYESALVDQWLDCISNEFESVKSVWYYTVVGYIPFNGKSYSESKKETLSVLKQFDSYIQHHTFFASARSVTIADIALFTSLVDMYAKLLTPDVVSTLPNLTRWFNTIANQPQVKAIVKSVSFAKEELQPQQSASSKEKKSSTSSASAVASKKDSTSSSSATPAASAAASNDDLMDALEADKAKKPKSELDSLPESKMVLDTTKKLMFSKRPILPDFFEQLWTFYDAKGYSWYTSSYNYNSENKVFYMTGNAVGGFIQRCDAVRKYALGVMNICGNKDEETPPFAITGCWLFRGPGVPKEMTEENPDSEYYTWKKLDPSSVGDKAVIKEQFMAEKIAGIDVLDRRYFK